MSQVDSFYTRVLPAHARFRSWEARMRAALGGDVRATPASDAEFDAWTETISDAGALVGRVKAGGHQLELGHGRRQPLGDEKIHVIFQISGRFHIEQFGRRVALEPGDWAFFIASEAFRHLHESPVEILVVAAPRRILLPDIPVERFSAQRFSAERGSSMLARSYVETLVAERASLHPLMTAELAATAVRLVRLSVMENLGARAEIGVRQMLQTRIRDFVDRHLQNTDLSVEMVAEAHHCSKRYVHKVFSAGGETLSHYILRARLERCHRDLRRPDLAHLSVTQIAFSWGFNSPGHFSRVFRRQFGICPSDCRASRPIAAIATAVALEREPEVAAG
jgi:AraC-like DNA-binding protein